MAPFRNVSSCTKVLISSVEMPGRMISPTRTSVSAASSQTFRMWSISRADLMLTERGRNNMVASGGQGGGVCGGNRFDNVVLVWFAAEMQDLLAIQLKALDE